MLFRLIQCSKGGVELVLSWRINIRQYLRRNIYWTPEVPIFFGSRLCKSRQELLDQQEKLCPETDDDGTNMRSSSCPDMNSYNTVMA